MPFASILSMFGGGGKSLPTLSMNPTSGNAESGASTGSAIGSGGISVLSGLNLGSSGILMLVLVGLVGLVVLFHHK